MLEGNMNEESACVSIGFWLTLLCCSFADAGYWRAQQFRNRLDSEINGDDRAVSRRERERRAVVPGNPAVYYFAADGGGV